MKGIFKMESIELNDGKGLFDKYGMIDEILMKMEALADAKGSFRCGLIWDITQMLKSVKDGMKKDDEQHKQEIEALTKMLDERNEKNA